MFAPARVGVMFSSSADLRRSRRRRRRRGARILLGCARETLNRRSRRPLDSGFAQLAGPELCSCSSGSSLELSGGRRQTKEKEEPQASTCWWRPALDSPQVPALTIAFWLLQPGRLAASR